MQRYGKNAKQPKPPVHFFPNYTHFHSFFQSPHPPSYYVARHKSGDNTFTFFVITLSFFVMERTGNDMCADNDYFCRNK